MTTSSLVGAAALSPRKSAEGWTAVRPPVFGALVNIDQILPRSRERILIERTCRAIAIAGPVYWLYSQPTRGRFTLSDAERLCSFASDLGLPVRAHTLVWHDLLPDWVRAERNPSTLRAMLQDHIRGVVSPLKGRIRAWDVVNEPLQPDDSQTVGLRHNHFHKYLGPAYIAIALTAARGADPGAMLGVNDFGLEGETVRARRRRDAMLTLLRRLVVDRVPIDYVGLQAHLRPSDTFSRTGIGTFINEVRQLGLRVLITELDVDDSQLPSDFPQRDAAVADTYSRFLDVVVRTDGVDSVTTWGLQDSMSWLQWYRPRRDGLPQRPLPFDSKGAPKLAWEAIRRHLEVAS